MLKLPTPAQLKARRASRNRGFAIESVAIGMIVILFATAVLYSAFTVIQRNIAKNTAQRVIPMASSEARLLYRNSPDFDGITAARLIDSGAIPVDSIEGTTFVVPFGGVVTVAAAADARFTMAIAWPESSNARALCTSLSAGPVGGGQISGPMGTEYVITSAPTSCTGPAPTLTASYAKN